MNNDTGIPRDLESSGDTKNPRNLKQKPHQIIPNPNDSEFLKILKAQQQFLIDRIREENRRYLEKRAKQLYQKLLAIKPAQLN